MEVWLAFPNGSEECIELEAENEDEIIIQIEKTINNKYKNRDYQIKHLYDNNYSINIKPLKLAILTHRNFIKDKGNRYYFAKKYLNEFKTLISERPRFLNHINKLKNLCNINDLSIYEHLRDVGIFKRELLNSVIYYILNSTVSKKFLIFNEDSVLNKLIKLDDDVKHKALHITNRVGDTRTIKYLLAKGAEHREFHMLSRKRTSRGNKRFIKIKPLNSGSSFFSDKKETGLPKNKLMYHTPAKDLHNAYGRDLLVTALKSGNYSFTRLVLLGKTRIDRFDRTKEKCKGTNTHSFIWYAEPDDIFLITFYTASFMELLVKAGYDITHIEKSTGDSLLHKMNNSFYGYKDDTIKYLIKAGLDPEFKNNKGEPALTKR